MSFRIAVCVGALLSAWVTFVPAQAQDGLPTLEEATDESRNTGRPILAMAGQKT